MPERTKYPGVYRDDTGYMVVVDVGVPGGKRKQARRRGYRTVKDALAARDELRDRARRGTYVEPVDLRFGPYLEDRWLPAIKATVKRSTWESYRRLITRHVVPHDIGAAKLPAVTGDMLNRLYGDMLTGVGERKAVSARTVQYAHTLIHRALKDAARWRLVVRNVAEDADPPRPQRREMRTWSADDLARFLASATGDRLYPLWALIAATGMRRGEALGLHWRDVDLKVGRVSVVWNLVEVEPTGDRPYGYAFTHPKTDAGRRTVALDKATVAALKAHRKRQAAERLMVGEGWRSGRHGAAHADLVFTTPAGEPIHPKTCSSLFETAVKRAGVPRLTLHGLRHSHATLALSAGVHVRIMQTRLGHSSSAVTADLYQHVTAGMDAEAAEAVAALVKRGPKIV